MIKSFARAGAGCAGVLAGMALAASPAFAHAQPRISVMGHGVSPTSMPTRPAVAAGVPQSQYFGGYDVTPWEGISSDGATFTLPKISCPDSSGIELVTLGEWINGAGGSFEQAGGSTDAFSTGDVACGYGSPVYQLEAGTMSGYGQDNTLPANQGDVIRTRVEETAAGAVVAITRDLTTGQEVTAEARSDGDVAQIWEGAMPVLAYEGSSGQQDYGIPSFGSVRFTRSQVGGAPISDVDATTRTNLNQDGPVQLAAGKFSAATPGSFTLTERSDQS